MEDNRNLMMLWLSSGVHAQIHMFCEERDLMLLFDIFDRVYLLMEQIGHLLVFNSNCSCCLYELHEQLLDYCIYDLREQREKFTSLQN